VGQFPLTLPLPEGYDAKRDIYPPHDHDGYRWAMTVDLDRCIGCGACAAACYAENNIGVVGEERASSRAAKWPGCRIERYQDPAQDDPQGDISADDVPALRQRALRGGLSGLRPPSRSKEGLNNQIYNRCIGTRFCSRTAPTRSGGSTGSTWQWPEPLPQLQLNPNVTVRSKGVMEKCSFCVQRIKEAHGIAAKNDNRRIRDGEIQPACVQTCPTGALIFGNLMDPQPAGCGGWRHDPRAYQVMGYLNTKPAVIYLKEGDANRLSSTHAAQYAYR
jgi:Fe-S-cluster-containing dehydrogenase component